MVMLQASKAASRLHATGGILFVLTAIVHCVGQFAPSTSSTPDPAGAALEQAMRAYVIPGTPFVFWNVMQCWGALFGGMTLMFGVLLLASLRAARGDPRVRRITSLVGVLAAVMQSVVALAFGTSPPAFFMVPAAVILALSAGLPERNQP